MSALAEESYNSKSDSKKRFSLKSKSPEPNELAQPFEFSQNTSAMMDESMKNLNIGKVGEPITLSDYERLI